MTDLGSSASVETERIKPILEAALLAAGRPLAMNDFEQLFAGDLEAPPRDAIRAALAELAEDWQTRSLALQEVASGFRAQVRDEFEPWLARLWDEKPPRYSRALLETLAIIAYRQPITRSEIEEIRGVSVSTQIMRTLGEREWVRVVGHRDAPGRPAMYGTTRQFLDHFSLKTLDQLPELSELGNPDDGYPELAFEAEPALESDGAPAIDAPDSADSVADAGAVFDGIEAGASTDEDPEAGSRGTDAGHSSDDGPERTHDPDARQSTDEDPEAADAEGPSCTPVS